MAAVCDVCPLLLPCNSTRTSYHGYIQPTNSGVGYEVWLWLPPGGSLKEARLEVDWKLRDLLKGHIAVVQKRLNSSSSVSSFLVELRSIVEGLVQGQPQLKEPLPPSVCNKLTSDLQEVGWQNITYVSPQLTLLKIKCRDERGRDHILSVQLSPTQYPSRSPSVMADTPLPFQPRWTPSCGLVGVVDQFTRWLAQFQILWDTLDELDTKTWVLEPERPTRACTYRRVVIGHNLSVHLVLNPTRPLETIPKCTFLGPDKEVKPLIEKLDSMSTLWNSSQSLLDNMSAVLGLQFPSRSTAQEEGMNNECEICYAYQLDGLAPDIVCDSCEKPFHYQCLYEWLKTFNIDSGRHNRTQVIGECPYCCQRLAIKAKQINRQ